MEKKLVGIRDLIDSVYGLHVASQYIWKGRV